MTGRPLICCAYPFGYGPAAKLLHIVRAMREVSGAPFEFPLVFLGTGIAHELARRCDLFDEVANFAPSDDRARDLIRSAAGLLSSMDRDYAAVAVELGRPIFVVDSLLWMRDEVPAVFRQARRFWAQEFVNVGARLAGVGPAATLVGPIVAPRERLTATRSVVVNLGGSESPGGFDPAYADFVARALLEARPFGPGAVLVAGDACIRYLRSRFGNGDLDMVSAPHETAVAMFTQAERVVTAPGLTATLECFQLGVLTQFLPPQNYSQWWILAKMRKLGLAPTAFHWQDLLADSGVRERMPEATRGPLVRNAIHSLAQDERAARRLRASLDATGDLQDLACRQRAFFESLGPNGAVQIACELAALVKSECAS
jgi:hypothetical protein